EVSERSHIGQVVDQHDVEHLGGCSEAAYKPAADPAKAVDTDANLRHGAHPRSDLPPRPASDPADLREARVTGPSPKASRRPCAAGPRARRFCVADSRRRPPERRRAGGIRASRAPSRHWRTWKLGIVPTSVRGQTVRRARLPELPA